MRHINPYGYSSDPALDAGRHYDWLDQKQSAWETARSGFRTDFMFDVMRGELDKLAIHMDHTDWTDSDHPWDECDDLRTYRELAADLVAKVKAGSAKHKSRLEDIADEYADRMADLEAA